jgi:16S rRNA (guanine527-N7)-methyltransferase
MNGIERVRRLAAPSDRNAVCQRSDLQSRIKNLRPMEPDRIADLLEPFLASSTRSFEPCHSEARSARESAVLSVTQLQSISTYIDILLRWNSRINLTAIRDKEQIVTRHFGESLFAARHLFPRCSSVVKGCEVADVGSGAGFPGIPLKLWAPQISLTLIESNQKKATFLREVTRALTLTGVNIQTTRAESLDGASFAVVTLRAVERFESILPVAAELVARGGRLALLIGQAQMQQAQSALPVLSWLDPIAIPASQSRVLAIACKR